MYRTLTCVCLVGLLLFAPAAVGRDYAVLISAGQATADDTLVNSCFWYNVYLQYTTLLEEGYAEDDVYVLYGHGSDFSSSHACYQPPESVTDYAVNRANIQSVFNTLGGIMTANDFLYVWWMGHGTNDNEQYKMYIDTNDETVWGYEMEDWVGQITDYDKRTFSWMTCFSGGILDHLEGPRSIVMSSATFYQGTADAWLCDTYHAEFHYPERCAWAWESPCGICGDVVADTNGDGKISFEEAFIYAEYHTAYSNPQFRDIGGIAADTFLSTDELICDGIGDNTWDGCRGNGCAVCAEKLVGYECYFENHPQCVLNTTCAGQFYDCDAACPEPTVEDQCVCDGIGDDTWDGCRGNGCAVCEEKVASYDCYFEMHPQCVLNTTCAGQFYDCDQSCPAPTKYDFCLVCDGSGDGTWNGCRGNGCAVCEEQLGGYDCYFVNHPQCDLNTTCAGQFYDCDAACPEPTAADVCVCDGSGDGTWDGCRGNGCAVCEEMLEGFECYFERHPLCVLNTTCAGQFYDCDAACPAPTEADRCPDPDPDPDPDPVILNPIK